MNCISTANFNQINWKVCEKIKWTDLRLHWPCAPHPRRRLLKWYKMVVVNGSYKHWRYGKKLVENCAHNVNLPHKTAVRTNATDYMVPHIFHVDQKWLHRSICYSCGSNTKTEGENGQLPYSLYMAIFCKNVLTMHLPVCGISKHMQDAVFHLLFAMNLLLHLQDSGS